MAVVRVTRTCYSRLYTGPSPTGSSNPGVEHKAQGSMWGLPPAPLGGHQALPGQACPPLGMLPSSSFPSSLVDHISSPRHQFLHHPKLPKPVTPEPPPPSVHLHCAG